MPNLFISTIICQTIIVFHSSELFLIILNMFRLDIQTQFVSLSLVLNCFCPWIMNTSLRSLKRNLRKPKNLPHPTSTYA